MSSIEKFREQLATLLPAAPDAVQMDQLRDLLTQIAGELPLAEHVDSIAQRAAGGYGRTQLLTFDQGELALVVLEAGARIVTHDHGVYDSDDCIVGMVMVVQGLERNRFYRMERGDELTEIEVRDLAAGQALVLHASMIHSVENPRPERAVSLHAYSKAQFAPATRKRRF